jgi:hypothetical protein
VHSIDTKCKFGHELLLCVFDDIPLPKMHKWLRKGMARELS